MQVIGEYVQLKSGRQLEANCPFHHEKSPSFMVNAENNSGIVLGAEKRGCFFFAGNGRMDFPER